MNRSISSKFLAFVLALVMVISMFPVQALAEETVTYTRITTADELVTGKYVMVVSTGYGPGILDGTWVTAVQPVTDGEVTNAEGAVWTLTVDGTSVTLTDGNGTSIAPKSGNNNGIISGDYNWNVTCTDGLFRFSGTGEDTVTLASNKGSSNMFRAYKNATVEGNPSGYPSDFTLYKQETTVSKDVTSMTPEASGTVAPGGQITLTCEAEGASFEVSTDNATWTGIEGSTYTIPGGSVGENRIYIRAALDGKYSKTLTLKYFVEGYRQITTASELVTGKYVMVVSTGYGPGVLDGTWLTAVQPVTDGEVTNDSGAVWTITVDGSTAKLTDSNGVSIAPKSGNNNGIISGDYNWDVTCTDGLFRFSGTGDDTTTLASNTGSDNKFRAYKNGTISNNPDTYPCDFTLYQFVKDPDKSEPEPIEKVSTPTAEPAAGPVKAGTQVTFSCATEGAVIQYHTGDGNWETSSQAVVTEAVTFYVRAVKDGVTSNVAEFAYTVAEEEPVPEIPLTDGDRVVIYNPANLKALSTTYSGFYNSGTDVTVESGIVSGYTDVDIWTVGVHSDGTYTFSTADGKKLSMGTQYSSTPLDDVNTSWSIEPATTEGCYYIKNAARNMYLEWYASKNNWSAYGSITESNEGLFAQAFFKIETEREGFISDPRDGDRVVIYNPGSGMALSQVYSGFYNTGAAVTLSDGKLAGYSETEIWTVGVNADGTYTFSTSDGKKFSMGASYSSTPLDEVNTNWNILPAATEDCIYIQNTAREMYLEWYASKNNWSAYGSIQESTESLFAHQFYLVPKTAEEPDPVPEGPLAEGDKVVIYNVANMKALSTKYSGFYNSGVAVSFSGDDLTGFTAAEVWTVGVNADGTYTFSTSEGKKLSMGASYTSTPLDDVNTGWNVLEAATEGCYYIQNAVRGNYLEWYADKDNWSSYSKVSNEALFAQAFYKVTGDLPSEGSTLPAEGSQVVIYNLSAQGVLASQDDNVDSPSITGVLAEIVDGKAVPENGAVIFTVEKNGEYYRFRNETYGYLCSNGTGNNAFYSPEASEDADWTLLDGKKGGFNMESRTAKYNGKYDQYLEYYADAYKTYSMYNVTDYDIYEFFFYGIGEDVSLTEGIVNRPRVDFGTLADAYLNMDYTFTFTVDAVFGVDGELTVKAGKTGEDGKPEETVLTANEDGSYTVPKEWIAEPSLAITVTGKDTKGVTIFGTAAVTVKDEPVIGDVTPLANSETGENRKPLISAQVFNVGENPEITMTIGDTAVEAGYDAEAGLVSYEPAQELAEGRTTVTVKVVRADGKETEKTWSFTVGRAQNQLYFGQLHSHTTYSDGSGTLDSALDYVANLPGSANVDFVAFTDHSNYFDTSSAANPEGALYDMGLASEYSQSLWNEYKGKVAAFNGSQSDIVALGGFEMTWSGGPGHINTFNTPGIVSRNNSTLNNKTSDAGMKAYYALLSQSEGAASISQFNHPGSTFGTFSDFAYYDAMIDSRIFLVEVGNGEGQVGAGGYYPSYEYYTMALDKGWHVAPTNNQDNHKGKWGNANDARDVIYTDDFSEQGLYEAIRNMRVYATEDKNLEITYSVNGLPLGSSISEVPDSLNLAVTVFDPDSSDSISKVEVIVNSGKTIHTWNDPADLASGSLSVTLSPDYSYYYIRVTEGDGDLAVTAPVWVGEPLKLGISSLECGTSTPVTDEALTLTTTLFNSEASNATVKSVTYTTGSTVLGTDTAEYTIPASGTLAIEFDYTPTVAKVMTVTATVVVEQNGKPYTFTKDIELDVQDASKLSYIGIDASHFNEYVAGNYKDSMGNFGELAAQYALRTVQLNSSEDLIAACTNAKYKAIILTAPSRRNGSALRDPYATYSDEEINALVAFNKAGGAVILAGWSDYYESYATFPAEDHMAAQQNKVLKALGSALRIGDDGTNDDSLNGGQTQRLYFNTYGTCFLTEGVEVDPEHPNDRMYTEVFSHYGGASVYAESGDSLPSTATAVVFAHSSTYSMDSDSDGLGGSIPKYPVSEGDERLLVMAMDELPGQGLIIVSGAAFMSNFEVQATISDSGSEKNYANYKICENLLQRLNPVTLTTIAEVRAQTEAGYKYTIEGVVTSNASGYDKDTAFFDCIYVQDATGGICCFPVAGNYKIGDRVRITGTTDFFQGEPELQVSSIEKIGEADPVEPTQVSAAEITDRSAEGKLVTLSGTVESFEKANGLVQTIMVKDAAGNVARVFIDGYITTSQDVENLDVGAAISVTGLASYDDTFNAPEGPFPRIRVRDRADVICTLPEHDCEKDGHSMDDGVVTKEPTCTEKGVKTYTCRYCKETETEEISALGHDWDDGVITKKPTCTRKGEMTYTCERCQATKTEPIPALGHDFKNGVCTRCHVDQKSVFTGDTIMIWILVLVVSAAAIVVLLLVARKKRNGKNGKYSK